MSQPAPWCFSGSACSRRPPTEKYPYGLERAEDLAGAGIALVIWASAAFAGYESVRKLIFESTATHPSSGAGIVGAIFGIIGNQAAGPVQMTVGRRINSATLIADAGIPRWTCCPRPGAGRADRGRLRSVLGDPVAGLAVTLFICHVGYEVTADVMYRLADGIDPDVIVAAEAAVVGARRSPRSCPRRWTGRTLRVEIEGWTHPTQPPAPPTTLAAWLPTTVPASCLKRAPSPGPRAQPPCERQHRGGGGRIVAVTNVDDIVVLSLFFGRSAGQHGAGQHGAGQHGSQADRRRQYLGFTALLIIAVAAAYGATFLPEPPSPTWACCRWPGPRSRLAGMERLTATATGASSGGTSAAV